MTTLPAPGHSTVHFESRVDVTRLRDGKLSVAHRGSRPRRLEPAREPGVDVFGEAALAHRPALIPAAEPEGGDSAVWAWAPSGDRAAVLTAAGAVEVWSLGDAEPRRVRTFSGSCARTPVTS